MSIAAEVRVARGDLIVDLRLSVAAGRVVVLLGPNGAGKSTFLRVLAGLLAMNSGRLVVDDVVLDDPAEGVFVPPERRSVGLVFQDEVLFPHLSVLENVAFGLRARRLPRPIEAAREWIERVEMRGSEGLRPAELSGGQAQRVAIARALAPHPRVLLLDEPMASLDATSRVLMRRELQRHLNDFDGTTVLVTHDPVEAAAMSDSLHVIEAGRLAQSGSLSELTARPRSSYVADLAGVNLWRGTLRGGDVRVAGAAITVVSGEEGEVFATLRPHSVSLHARRPEGSPRNVVVGRVRSIERVGDRLRVSLTGNLPVVAEVTSAAADELGLAAGAEVWASFKASEVEVYAA